MGMYVFSPLDKPIPESPISVNVSLLFIYQVRIEPLLFMRIPISNIENWPPISDREDKAFIVLLKPFFKIVGITSILLTVFCTLHYVCIVKLHKFLTGKTVAKRLRTNWLCKACSVDRFLYRPLQITCFCHYRESLSGFLARSVCPNSPSSIWSTCLYKKTIAFNA